MAGYTMQTPQQEKTSSNTGAGGPISIDAFRSYLNNVKKVNKSNVSTGLIKTAINQAMEYGRIMDLAHNPKPELLLVKKPYSQNSQIAKDVKNDFNKTLPIYAHRFEAKENLANIVNFDSSSKTQDDKKYIYNKGYNQGRYDKPNSDKDKSNILFKKAKEYLVEIVESMKKYFKSEYSVENQEEAKQNIQIIKYRNFRPDLEDRLTA